MVLLSSKVIDDELPAGKLGCVIISRIGIVESSIVGSTISEALSRWRRSSLSISFPLAARYATALQCAGELGEDSFKLELEVFTSLNRYRGLVALPCSAAVVGLHRYVSTVFMLFCWLQTSSLIAKSFAKPSSFAENSCSKQLATWRGRRFGPMPLLRGAAI